MQTYLPVKSDYINRCIGNSYNEQFLNEFGCHIEKRKK